MNGLANFLGDVREGLGGSFLIGDSLTAGLVKTLKDVNKHVKKHKKKKTNHDFLLRTNFFELVVVFLPGD